MSWSDIWQDLKAWQRGERRIKKGRGRVYVKKDGSPNEPMQARAAPTATITAVVTRADGSTEIHHATNVGVEHGDSSHDGRP